MLNAEDVEEVRAKAQNAKQSISQLFDGPTALCDCTRCYGQTKVLRLRATIRTHRHRYGVHLNLDCAIPTRTSTSSPHDMGSPSRQNSSSDDEMGDPVDGNLDADDRLGVPPLPEPACSYPWSQSPSRSGPPTYSPNHSPNHSLSHSLSQFRSLSHSGSRSRSRSVHRASSPASSDSDKEVPEIVPTDAEHDVLVFGELLSQEQSYKEPPPLRLQGGYAPRGEANEDGDERDEDEDEEDGEGGAGDPDGQAQHEQEPEIQVPPFDAEDGPADPDDDNDGAIPAFDEDPILRNVYLRVWLLYAFGNATHDTIQAMLESHQLTLRATARAGILPPHLLAQIDNMPRTLRSLERRIGMDFSDLIVTYPVCPIKGCGKRYTVEELAQMNDPQCTRQVADPRCPGILYTDNILADGKRKRTPSKSFPYNPLPAALGRLTSRIGILDLMQHWRGPGDDPVDFNVPPPLEPQAWFDGMGIDSHFGDMSEGWNWRCQGTGLQRRYDGEEYADEPTGDATLSLSRLPIGLSLGMNMDGFQAFRGKYTRGGNYSVNGVYIVVNNLPFYQRFIFENMILAIVVPGPHEPKGYALDQMLEPLVDDLIELANGMELPVYNSRTHRVEQRLIYANLSTLFLDWIARIKCSGHVGATAEHNHCMYCKIRQCYLALEQGYEINRYDFRSPFEHLQFKHAWLRAPEREREDLRQENGTIFVELDRIPGFYSFDNCPIDAMHLFDHGVTAALVRDIIFKPGMLRKRYHRQPEGESPEARFDAFIQRTYFPSFCGRLPTNASISALGLISKMGSRTKAEQWRHLLPILPLALFEAWRVGDTIPEGDIPRGGQRTKNYKTQVAKARLVLERRLNAHNLEGGELDDAPLIEDCASSRNPREYFSNTMRYCVAYKGLSRHQVTRQDISQMTSLLEQLGRTFARMNVHLTPTFHCATHIGDHILKWGNLAGTSNYDFERANRVLINVNTNGHGQGVLEATMAKGFMRRMACYQYVRLLQAIDEPTEDDIATTQTLLAAVRYSPEHEVQRGMLNAVLGGEAPFQGQEPLRLATVSAKVDFQDRKYERFYNLMVAFCNEHNPFPEVVFYGLGRRPPGGIYIPPRGSTVSYSHLYRHGIRYGVATHHRGVRSRYGYIDRRIPVLIEGIYKTTVEVEGEAHEFLAVMVRRFAVPDRQPIVPWNYWRNLLQIDAWQYGQLGATETVLADTFCGVFALCDIQLSYGHYWFTSAMINTDPEDFVANNE